MDQATLTQISELAKATFKTVKRPKNERKPMTEEMREMYRAQAAKARETKRLRREKIANGEEVAEKATPKSTFKSKLAEFESELAKLTK